MVFKLHTLPLKEMVTEMALIVSLALVAALAVNSLSPNGIPLISTRGVQQCQDTTADPAGKTLVEIETIDVFSARQLFETGGVLFVDARGPEFFKNGHIRGAVSLQPDRFEQAIGRFRQTCQPATRIVIYCYSQECPEGHELAHRLAASGYTAVSVMIGGLVAWEQEGLPVE